jgi:hypothetical protein
VAPSSHFRPAAAQCRAARCVHRSASRHATHRASHYVAPSSHLRRARRKSVAASPTGRRPDRCRARRPADPCSPASAAHKRARPCWPRSPASPAAAAAAGRTAMLAWLARSIDRIDRPGSAMLGQLATGWAVLGPLMCSLKTEK